MMKNHIDVSSVLRHAVSESYSNLVTRPTGVAVRVYIEAQIQAARDCEVTVIDFSQVGMMDFSCADEIVAKLVMQHEKGTPTFVFTGLSESHIEAIDVVLERHGMSLVSHEADTNSYIAVTH
jgi:anti-anti-sigma regulatory factor